jgi:hypothetical protein
MVNAEKIIESTKITTSDMAGLPFAQKALGMLSNVGSNWRQDWRAAYQEIIKTDAVNGGWMWPTRAEPTKYGNTAEPLRSADVSDSLWGQPS